MEQIENVAEQPQRNVGRIIARNTIFGMSASVIVRVVGVLFSNVLVIRVLGDAGFGEYSLVLAWTALFAVLGDLGITQYMTREVARSPDKGKELFWDVTVLRFLLAILAAAVTVIGAILKPYDPQIIMAIALYTSSYFMMAVLEPITSIIAGNERIDVLSVYTVIGQVLYMVLGTVFLYLGFGFVSLIVASLVTIPIVLVLSGLFIRRNKLSPPTFHVNPALWSNLIRAGIPFAFIQLSLTYAYRFDTILLENYYTPEVVGWYNAAYNLTRALLILTAAFSGSLGLTLAREHATNPDAVRPWYHRLVKFMLLLGLPLAVGGMLLAGKIIGFLHGSEYTAAAIAFAILIWDTPLLMYTALCGNLSASMKKEGMSARIYAAEAIFNIAMNFVLIPQYGMIAASFITVATELAGAMLFYLLFRRELGPGLGLNHLLRIVLAATLMGVVVFVLRDFHLVISIGAGVVSYLLFIWLTRALTEEERAMLTGFGKRALRRVTG